MEDITTKTNGKATTFKKDADMELMVDQILTSCPDSNVYATNTHDESGKGAAHKLDDHLCSGESKENEIDNLSKFNCTLKDVESKRNNYSPIIVRVLMDWLDKHRENPYPNEEERVWLCNKTGLSRKQLRIWLINSRKRKIVNKSEKQKKRVEARFRMMAQTTKSSSLKSESESRNVPEPVQSESFSSVPFIPNPPPEVFIEIFKKCAYFNG